jgi:hypothetical protein
LSYISRLWFFCVLAMAMVALCSFSTGSLSVVFESSAFLLRKKCHPT